VPADRAPEVRSVLTAGGAVRARQGQGGTAPERVKEQMDQAADALKDLKAFADSQSDGSAYRPPK